MRFARERKTRKKCSFEGNNGPQVDEGARQTGPQVDGKKKKPKKKKDPVPVLPVSERQAYCQFFVLAIDAFGGQYAFTIIDCYPYEGRWTAQKLIDKFHARKRDDDSDATESDSDAPVSSKRRCE